MEKLKLLYITREFSDKVDKNFYYFAEELSKLCDLQLWKENGNIHDILNQIRFRPDFILLNDLRENECPTIRGLSTINIPFGIIMHDLHYHIDARKKFVHENNVRYIFSIYRDAFLQTYPELANLMQWLPHFANPQVFKDYNQPKTTDFLLMGCTARKYYPLRHKMLTVMKRHPGFVYHEHPGYKDIQQNEKAIVSFAYAKEINRSKMFLTCDSVFHYPLRKYYEVLASKTLLLASSSQELLDLGFVPGTHYVSVTEKDFEEKAIYYLNQEEQRTRIAEEGYRFVHQNHSSAVRASEFIGMVESILRT